MTSPKPPATLIKKRICAPSAAVLAVPIANSAAAKRPKRGIRQKIARAKGTFVRRAPRKKQKEIRSLGFVLAFGMKE